MPISTNSIIHYTDTFDKLKSILKEGLAIKYCSEHLVIDSGKGSKAAHPMISFCDVPLSQSYKHFDAYGRYGIGLTKNWANEMGINPVLYLESKSTISKTFGSLLADRRKENTNLTSEQKTNILRLKCFTKNYSGALKRNKVNVKEYRFYDEREWRLVPESSQLAGAFFSVNLEAYLKNKEAYNNKIANIRFAFKATDISYIIVNNTTEIPEVIEVLRKAYYSKCTASELDILFSKIASTEQIINDY